MAEDRLDKTLMVIITATLSVVLICSFAIPTITGSSGLAALTDAQNSQYGGLIGVVVTVLIIGLIIPIVRGYNQKQR